MGNSAKILFLALALPVVMFAAVALDFVDFASLWADLARIFFFIAPVLFVVSAVLGLAARRRA